MSEKQTMLVVGGCRSGKSSFAEKWITSRFKQKTYIATTVVGDDEEMKRRVGHHRQNRCQSWQTIEEPVDIAPIIATPTTTHVYLVDCLTLWLTNLLLQGLSDDVIEEKIDELTGAIASCPVSIVLVANEVGLGIVPDNSLTRRFRDLAGWCNQRVGACCDKVVFMAAGLPMNLK